MLICKNHKDQVVLLQEKQCWSSELVGFIFMQHACL